MNTEGLGILCSGLGIADEDDNGNVRDYRKTEYCLDNLKDLQRYLRRDETRDVFMQLCRWNTLSRDLVPIIEHYQSDSNLVINVVKILVFLTMPVDPTSEGVAQQIEYLWDLKAALTRNVTITVVVSLLEQPLSNLESSLDLSLSPTFFITFGIRGSFLHHGNHSNARGNRPLGNPRGKSRRVDGFGGRNRGKRENFHPKVRRTDRHPNGRDHGVIDTSLKGKAVMEEDPGGSPAAGVDPYQINVNGGQTGSIRGASTTQGAESSTGGVGWVGVSGGGPGGVRSGTGGGSAFGSGAGGTGGFGSGGIDGLGSGAGGIRGFDASGGGSGGIRSAGFGSGGYDAGGGGPYGFDTAGFVTGRGGSDDLGARGGGWPVPPYGGGEGLLPHPARGGMQWGGAPAAGPFRRGFPGVPFAHEEPRRPPGFGQEAGWRGQVGQRPYMPPKLTHMNFPRYTGGDALEWVQKTELFFSYQEVPEVQWVQLASFHLEDDAFQLTHWFLRGRDYVPWAEFVDGFTARFGPLGFEDFEALLQKLRQKGTVMEYRTEFEKVGK
ncbi:hypothetical protein KSP39_PZI018770 [Platanthera zijinensis]|uniref:Retrotransposon gag domain-containing protein n=1 Tax=Platanthera zijinensis TaxID=2320716 RepID=A0AAP0FYS7_9ASPA